MQLNSLVAALLLTLGALASLPISLHAATAYELDRDGRAALHELYLKNPKAAEIANQSAAVLIFPTVVKAGFIFGAQGGEGVLLSNGRNYGYYHTSAISYGMQAGAQKFGYALFFTNRKALSYLKKSGGWEIGVGPSIVVVDAGVARTLTSTTLQDDIYAFIFSQKGLMAGLGLQGTKITQYTPDK